MGGWYYQIVKYNIPRFGNISQNSEIFPVQTLILDCVSNLSVCVSVRLDFTKKYDINDYRKSGPRTRFFQCHRTPPTKKLKDWKDCKSDCMTVMDIPVHSWFRFFCQILFQYFFFHFSTTFCSKFPGTSFCFQLMWYPYVNVCIHYAVCKLIGGQ